MPNGTGLQNIPVNIKFKLAALWTSVMFCYVYGDFFSLFVPGRIQDLMNGDSGAGSTTPVKLLMFAMMMTIPAVMIFLSLALKASVNRWLNMIVGVLFTIIMILVVATSIREWMVFYTFLGCVEILLTLVVVLHAIKWPRVVTN